tara:strand:- start:41584 stop:42189 length:606 start_codon:yes stop_codon:yes gene_type:complete
LHLPTKYNLFNYLQGAHIKHLITYLTAAITLTYGCAYAETENFNMSLSGDFQKDYCSITLPTPKCSSTTLEPATDRPGRDVAPIVSNYVYAVPGNERTELITCSAGTYTISLHNDASGIVTTSNYQMIVIGEIAQPDFLPLANGYIDASNVISASNIVSDGTGLTAQLFLTPFTAPLDNDVNSLPSTFSHTFSNIITIEKQ